MTDLRRVMIKGDAADVRKIWDAVRDESVTVVGYDSSMTVAGREGVLELTTADPEAIRSMQLVRLMDVKVRVANV